MKEKTEKCLEDRRRGANEVVCWRLDRRRLEEGEEGLLAAVALLDSLSACKKESRARISDAPRIDGYCLVFPNFCKKPK